MKSAVLQMMMLIGTPMDRKTIVVRLCLIQRKTILKMKMRIGHSMLPCKASTILRISLYRNLILIDPTGSGDSTLPSPLPQTRNKPQVVVADAQPEEPIVFSYASLHPRMHPYLEPPSPAVLTAALNALSPLKDAPYLEDPTPLSGPDLEIPSPPSGTTGSVDSAASSTSQSSNSIASRRPSPDEGLARVGKEVASDGARHEDGYEEALRESIKGIYRLWMATRRKDPISPLAGDDTAKSCSEGKELFLRIVGEVVQLSK
jgi:hypothetical protein